MRVMKKTPTRKRVPTAVAKIVSGAVVRNAKIRNMAKSAEVNPISAYLNQMVAKGGSSVSLSPKKAAAALRDIRLAILREMATKGGSSRSSKKMAAAQSNIQLAIKGRWKHKKQLQEK